MKIDEKQSINKEINTLVNNLFSGKKITKGDIVKIKKMKGRKK